METRYIIADSTGRTKYSKSSTDQLAGLPVALKSTSPATPDEFLQECRDADIILVTAHKITRENLPLLSSCKAVVRYGTGLDNIDLDACRERGVQVFNVRGFCIDELADHSVAFYLALARQTALSTERVRKGVWSFSGEYPLYSLSGRTAGIVGAGDVGMAVSRRLKAFGMDVLAYDPRFENAAGPAGLKISSIEKILQNSDAVFLHCPLNEHTFHMLGEKEFDMMKSSAFLINAARGAVVDEKALISALENKKIAGAGLDVLEQEPPSPENPLLHMENVLITPHCGAFSEEALLRLENRVFEHVAGIVKSLLKGS